MKIEDIREMSVEDLQAKEIELRETIFKARFRKSLGEVDAVKVIRQNRKRLAQIKTVLRQRELQ
ncbi:MAG: 50S ribosomal protein L29 [Blastocatellia bacterium]|jgi:large subunit ribosomal protein L29|nr:50S ribosomal protein L29 [Blastocatellia bacterium]